MKTIVLDGAYMPTREEAHYHLATRLNLPDYYGNNLDALYDLLTERGTDTRLVLYRFSDMEAALGQYGAFLLDTLKAAAKKNPHLTLAFDGQED